MTLADDIKAGLAKLEGFFAALPQGSITDEANAAISDLHTAAANVADAEVAKVLPTAFSPDVTAAINDALDLVASQAQAAADAKIASVTAAKASLASAPVQ
jgi:hypothetical protein